MKIKKLLLVVILIIALLGGCGSDESSQIGDKGVSSKDIVDIFKDTIGDTGKDLEDVTDAEIDGLDDVLSDVLEDVEDDVLLDVCIPICKDKECGDDGCGGSCGICGSNSICNFGKCECNSGYGNCNNNINDGCETLLSNNSQHCGGCNNSCGNNAFCSGTTCICNSGYGNCDGVWTNGCEANFSTDPKHCGDCATNCGDNTICNNKVCACYPGYKNCNGFWSDGCEINIKTDINNCGDCNNVCVKTDNVSSTRCVNGDCQVDLCNADYRDCDGIYSNGCEINIKTDVNNCGDCNNVCVKTDNVSSTRCVNGDCQVDLCNADYRDCDGIYSNGCEINIKTDVNNCGDCGADCSLFVKNVNKILCNNGSCDYESCIYPYEDKDKNRANGCEYACQNIEGALCNIDNNPCCEGYSCVIISNKYFKNEAQKDSKCYKDCTNDQTICSPSQQCIGWKQGQSACFEVTTISNGTFSNCKSYKDGEQPGPTDQPGTASIKFSLGGISYNFTMCVGDFEVVDSSGTVWIVEIYDTSKLQTKKIVYLYNIIVDPTVHAVGTQAIGEKIQPVVYELLLDSSYNTIKATLHALGINGTVNFTAVGTGGKTPTTGILSNVLMMGYDWVACDNSAGNPCQ